MLLLALAIAGCETTGGGAFGGSAEARAQRLALDGEFEEAAGAYIGLAERRALYVAGSDVRNLSANLVLGGVVELADIAVAK